MCLEVIFTLKCFICLFFFGKIKYIHLRSKKVKDRNLMTDTSVLEDLNHLKSFFFSFVIIESPSVHMGKLRQGHRHAYKLSLTGQGFWVKVRNCEGSEPGNHVRQGHRND